MKLFKDWRECDQSCVVLPLQREKVYYIQARAWHFKGYLGGTHSWITLWSNEYNEFVTIELSDRETLKHQGARILLDSNKTNDDGKHSPVISARKYNSKWFGAKPAIVSESYAYVSYKQLADICNSYPISEYRTLTRNCNTFISYVIFKLNLNIRRPVRSVGFKNKQWWEKNYG